MNQIYTFYEKAKNSSGFINLISTNFSDHFTFPKEILKREVEKYIDSRKYSPDSKGNINTRKYISKSFENVFLTASTSESYFLVLSSLSNIGDKVSLPKPSYPLFEHLLNGIKMEYEFYELKFEDNWEIDISKLNPKNKFLVLISPSNPTGTCISQKTLNEILSWASKNKVIVILDSVFEDFSKNKLKIKTDYLAFKLNGISKQLALPDMKLAYLEVFSNSKELLSETIEKLEIQNDTYLNASSLIQEIYPTIHRRSKRFQEKMNKDISFKREHIHKELIKLGFDVVKPTGGIHILFRIEKPSSLKSLTEEEVVVKLLKKHKIFIHPGYFYDFEERGYLSFVMSVLDDKKDILEALKIIKSICLQ